MKESRKPQQQENLENLLMQLKINLDRDDLDTMCARAVKEEGERFVSPLFSRIWSDRFSFIYTTHSEVLS